MQVHGIALFFPLLQHAAAVSTAMCICIYTESQKRCYSFDNKTMCPNALSNYIAVLAPEIIHFQTISVNEV